MASLCVVQWQHSGQQSAPADAVTERHGAAEVDDPVAEQRQPQVGCVWFAFIV